MKKLLLVWCIFFAATILHAQKVYFIYFQSESGVPFYLKFGDKVVSSTTEGYLILPKLRDSTYNFFIGFPGAQNERRFSVIINKADRGFVIKKFNDDISLLDLQTLTNYKSIQAAVSPGPTQTRNDSFTKLLSQAADDTTLLVESLAIKEVKKEEKAPAAEPAPPAVSATGDSVQKVAAIKTEAVLPAAEKAPVVAVDAAPKEEAVVGKVIVDSASKVVVSTNSVSPATAPDIRKEQVEEPKQEFRRSVVLRHAESSTSEGFGLVFLDVTEGLIDTVRIVIPNTPVVMETPVQPAVVADRKFLDLPDTVGTKAGQATGTAVPAAKEVAKCTAMATDDDFFKIRRDMAAKKVEEDMIAQAKKHFKSRCFRTEHIKYLSVLFLTDAGKYQFFDAAHMHVSDVQKFEGLQTEISDPYYINRFKALVAR